MNVGEMYSHDHTKRWRQVGVRCWMSIFHVYQDLQVVLHEDPVEPPLSASHRECLYLMMNIMPLGPVNRCQGRIDLDINTVVKASIISYTVPRYTSQVRSRRTEAPLNRIAAVVYPF